MTMRDILAAIPANVINANRQLRLTSLVWSIPLSSKKIAHCVYMLTQYALGVDYINHNVFLKSIRGQNAIAERKAEVKKGQVTFTGQEEPFEQFLIKALATSKTWEELVQQHRIYKRFINIQNMWQHREYFIMYICDAYYPKEEGVYLAFRCIFRTNEAIVGKVLLVRDSHYYKTRLQSWMSKQVHEIEKLEDKQLSLLIQSVKKEMTLTATIKNLGEYLNFQWIDKFCELHWLNFLCFQLQSSKDKEIFKTCELRRKITWRKFDKSQRGRYNGEVAYRLEKKLLRCLKNYANFEQYFADEIQIILLNSIRKKVPWQEVKNKINELFSENMTEDESKQNVCQNFDDEIKKEVKPHICQQSCSGQQLQESTKKGRKISLLKEQDICSPTKQSDTVQQQKQILSLIKKANDCFKSIQNNNFHNMTSDALAHYAASHKREMEALAQEKVAYYRQFPEQINVIQDDDTKMLMMSLLAFEKKSDINEPQISGEILTKIEHKEKNSEQFKESDIAELLKYQSRRILQKMGLQTKAYSPIKLQNDIKNRQ